jgi:formate-dependent nitrite reductase membrane component NrfD
MGEPALSYYGKPIIKEPVWKTEIPNYFFTGGLAGASATVSAAARLAGNEPLGRRSLFVAAGAVSVSPYFLIKDLGRPLRFYNMMRVFKVTSPMSVGAWIIAAEGTSTGIAAACELFAVLPRVRATGQAIAGLLGPAMASYTGALVADSVVPVWHEGRRELPIVFAASSAAAAGGVAAALVPTAHARPARRLAVMGALAEVAAHKLMEKRMGGLIAEPFHHGEGGRYARAAETALLAGAAVLLAGGRTRVGAVVGGTLLAAGSWCTRFSIFHAGKASASDPTYTSLPQKSRGAERGQPAITR